MAKFFLTIFLFFVFFYTDLLELSIPQSKRCCTPPPIFLVENKVPKAVIIISQDSTEHLKASALILSDYIYKSTNAKIPVVSNTESIEPEATKIWVGRSPYSNKQSFKFNELKGDSFGILIKEDNYIVISGSSDLGTEFGIYEFLERFIGVRWLIPGPFGEHIPKNKTIRLLPQQIIQNPAFYSRSLSGLRGGKVQSIWARRNRMHGQIKFHHNLLKLFPVSEYKNSNLDFFPLINGHRFVPGNHQKRKWQPCFSAPGIVDEAIKNICDYFKKNPDQTSFSLGINDGGGFCQCEKCKAKVGAEKNFLNFQDYSELYYDWANRVAEGVLKKYPDKWFGCLAYREVAEPPMKFKVHPRIVPFMTYDRMKWIDRLSESKGKALTEKWDKQSFRIGWYDYIYGTPYLVPRVYFHKMAEYYKFAYEHGVHAMYAEAYPNWGEGPKLYIALKLQWDPYLDVDALLKEWYVAAVGIQAADDLEKYYQLWENFWTNRVKMSNWFQCGEQFLCFKQPGYLDQVTYEDIDKSRRFLKNVIRKTKTPEQKQRADLLLNAFEYYEASVVSYLGLVEKKYQPGKNSEYYKKMSKKRLNLVNSFENDPVLVHPIRFDKKDKFIKLRF